LSADSAASDLADPDCDADPNSYGHGHSDAYGNRDADADSNADANSDRDGYPDPDAYRDRDRNGHAYPDSDADGYRDGNRDAYTDANSDCDGHRNRDGDRNCDGNRDANPDAETRANPTGPLSNVASAIEVWTLKRMMNVKAQRRVLFSGNSIVSGQPGAGLRWNIVAPFLAGLVNSLIIACYSYFAHKKFSFKR